MVNNCSKRNSNWEIDMIEWLEIKSKFEWKRNIQLASTSNYLNHIQTKTYTAKKNKNKINK